MSEAKEPTFGIFLLYSYGICNNKHLIVYYFHDPNTLLTRSTCLSFSLSRCCVHPTISKIQKSLVILTLCWATCFFILCQNKVGLEVTISSPNPSWFRGPSFNFGSQTWVLSYRRGILHNAVCYHLLINSSSRGKETSKTHANIFFLSFPRKDHS